MSEPTLESRHRLLTMPCDVPRLVRQRFRGHGEDIASKAMLAWLDPARRPDELVTSYEDAPRDARLWLTAWPYKTLARKAIADKLADTEPMTPKDGPAPESRDEENRELFERTAAALGRLAKIDPAGYAMMVDSLRGVFHTATWRASLGATDVAVNDRRALTLYRYAALFFGALERVEPGIARSAIEARRFSGGDPSDATALAATREATGDKQLAIGDWRAQYKRGVATTLDVLREESALGAEAISPVEAAFRRVLRVDEGATDAAFSDDTLLSKIADHARAAGPQNDDEHLSPDVVASLAAGGLDGPEVASASHHLLTCRDRRCSAFLRWEVGGREAVRRDLSGPMSEPPPGMTVAFTQGPISQHLLNCRDVLWDAFTQMARAEGRSIDDLVNDAMARYRVVREYAAPPPPPKPASPARTSSVPPRPGSMPPRPLSTRPQARTSSVPPARTSSMPPAPPSRRHRPIPPLYGDEELTPPEGAVRRSKPPEAPPSSLRASVPPPPPVPRLLNGDSETREPATIRAPALQHPEKPAVPRPAESARTLPGIASTSERTGEMPTHALRTVELAASIVGPEPATPPVRPTEEDALNDKLEALPARSKEFSDAEDTSPKMNLVPLNPPLFIEYAGRRGHVNHPRFVIGRERTTCHLVLPDSNVSRQHAVVEWNNGGYYMVDLGSTNGIGCGGHRIHRKLIVEGDRFDISGHTISFSFRL